MKTTPLSSMHDKLFKKSMSDLDIAYHFFANHLPDWLMGITDLSQLVLKPGSFVNPKFKAYYTDMLYEVPIQNQTGYIYLLAEHKSYPSRFLPLQLLEYMVAIWRRHLDNHPNDKALPLIFPMTFYHGKQSPYPYSTDLVDCFASPHLAKKILHRPFELIDVTTIPDQDLTQHQQAALFQLAQKYIFNNDLLPILQQFADSGLLEQFDNEARHHLMTVIKYLLECGESNDSEAIISVLTEALPNDRGNIMTIAQQLEQKGIEKNSKAIARNALQQGADTEFVAKITELTLEQVKTIQAEMDNEEEK